MREEIVPEAAVTFESRQEAARNAIDAGRLVKSALVAASDLMAVGRLRRFAHRNRLARVDAVGRPNPRRRCRIA